VLRPRLNQLRQYPPRAVAVAADSGASAPAGDPASLPTLALVTPSYKQGAFIRATIDSVLGQGYPKLRYVVMDGGSADATQDILASYGDRLDWWSGPDRGQADAINKGFERVSGEIMGWVNSDDLLLPGTLAFVARFFRDHPEIDLIYGHRIIIDAQGQEIGRWVLPRHDPAALASPTMSAGDDVLARRLWARRPLDAGFHYAMDWISCSARNGPVSASAVQRFLGCFRVHGEQKTAQTPS
jgi:glycosyltransferase involved in cell wall biosynthesis